MTDDEIASLLAANAGLVGAVLTTQPIYRRCDEDEDRQEGFVGLLKACKAWDSTHGASFASFAFTCIWHEIQKGRDCRYGVDYRRAIRDGTLYESPLSIEAASNGVRPIADVLEARPLCSDEQASPRAEVVAQLAELLNERERIAVFTPKAKDAAECLGVTTAAVHKSRVRAYARLRRTVEEVA